MAIPSADQHPTTELPLAANGAVTISLADDAAVTGSAWGDAVEAQRLPASTERYLLKGELAHGGMGVVYRATDRVLNREVALKVLRDKFGAHSAAARRFADEARITAQLQHPAIPPIHDLGVLADGRPFLAMKLIKGETLEDLLATRTDPGVDRGRFVAAFEQVCQAIAYAHAHRVIHRDLKPANVMVGSFAEVQVMDWGLAKVLPEAKTENVQEDPDATWGGSEIRTGRDSNGVETQAGSILGTPAFMPPEQAIGAIEQIDERSDVFGLGAILAVMLTGQPPFLAHTREAVRILAAQGMVDDCLERLATCGADPGLVTLCKRCLSPLKADRPRNADEVAKAVAALRSAADERARQAELERIRSEGERAKAEAEAREQRKRRRTQLALIGTVGLLLAAASGFAWWQDRQATLQRERLARNAEAVTNLILQAEESLQADDPDRAAVAVEQAAKRMADGGADGSSERLHQLRANLILLRELDRIDNLRWTPTVEGIWFPGSKNLVALWAQAFANFGILPGTTSPPDAAARLSHTPIRERVLVALDRWLMSTRSGSVAAILAASDPDAFRTEVRTAIQSGNVDLLKHLARKEEALNQPAWFVALTNETSLPLELRRTILERAIKNRPGDLALLMDLACLYPFNQREGAEERARWYQAAVASHPRNSAAWNGLGFALVDQHNLGPAIAALREAVRLDPRFASAQNSLGYALMFQGDLEGAMACHQEAIRLDPDNPWPHANLGIILKMKKDYEGATACYNTVIELDPNRAKFRWELAEILMQAGDRAGALAAGREAVRLAPTEGKAHAVLIDCLQTQGDLDRAIACCEEARRLVPKQAAFWHDWLAYLYLEKGDTQAALEAGRESVRLDPHSAQGHCNYGRALFNSNDVDGAIAQYREAIRINPKCSNAYNSLGLALREKGEDDAAVASLQQAIQCDPKNHHPYNNLGYISKDRGDLNEAIAYFQKALQIKPDYYYTHVGMGLARWEKGELEEASASFREALRINPKYESAYGHLSQILYEQGDLSGAIFACENALRLNPKLEDVQQRLSKLKKQSALLPRLEETIQGISKPFTAAEGCDFAWLCAEPFRQQYAAATRLYASAFAADQKSAAQLREGYNNRYHASAAAALAGCGKGTDAPSEPEARAALRRQSLEWLRLNVTNLASTKKQNIAKRLSYWLNDPAFAGVRPGPERVDMPDSERMEWDNFWSDLQKMYDKAQK